MFRLQEHQLVVVSPPDVRHRDSDVILFPFEAVVVGLDQRVVTLMAMESRPLLYLPPKLPDVLLTSEEDGRMMALRGTVRYERAQEHLRFRVDDESFRAPWRSSRLLLVTPVSLRRVDGGEETVDALTHDVGPDGLLLHESTELPRRGGFEVKLTLPGHDEPVTALGRVRADRQDGRLALDFVRIAPFERSRIRAYLSAHLRDRVRLAQTARTAEEHF